MKKKHSPKNFYVRWLSALLILSLLISLGGCSGFATRKARGADKLINNVEVMIPNPTAPEAMVSLQGSIALQYYIEARMYLEKLSMVNAEEIDRAELTSLVNDTITAFENAEKMSEFLSSSVDLWMEMDDKRDAPKVKVLHKAEMTKKTSLLDLFTLNAYAADQSASEMTAQAIVDAFDKAENGKKLKTLAELLGTDARHAMEQLKIAQATLEGEDAMAVAEQATNCIMVAKTLKTAGTVAGLAIAAAPLTTSAIAAMSTGELIATGAGCIMGTVNTALEIGSTGATLYCGTDENFLTKGMDELSDSKAMKTANMFVSLAGVGYNIKNVIQNSDKLVDKAGRVDDLKSLLSSPMSTNSGKEASDLFGIVSFSLEESDMSMGALMCINSEYVNEGLNIILKDTEIGTSSGQQEAMKAILKEAGFSNAASIAAVSNAMKLIKEGGNAAQQESDSVTQITAELVDSFLAENELISPSGDFDLDGYIAEKQEFMESLTKAGNAEESTLKDPGGEIPTIEEVCGTYAFSGYDYFLDRDDDNFGSYTFSVNSDGMLRFEDDEYPLDAPYDASTGMATFHDILDIVLTATKEDGKINIKLQFISGDELYGEYYGSRPIS